MKASKSQILSLVIASSVLLFLLADLDSPYSTLLEPVNVDVYHTRAMSDEFNIHGSLSAHEQPRESWLKVSQVALLTPAQAEQLRIKLETACNNEDATSCQNLAMLYSIYSSPVRDLKKAFAANLAGCEMGSLSSCFLMGFNYLGGKGVQARPKYGKHIMELTCKSGLASACHQLARYANSYSGTHKDLFPQSIKLASVYSERSCALGSAQACLKIANSLYFDLPGDTSGLSNVMLNIDGQALKRKQHVLSHFEAFKLFTQYAWHMGLEAALDVQKFEDIVKMTYSGRRHVLLTELDCEEGDSAACLEVGKAYADGEWGKLNLKISAQYYAKSCGLGQATACEERREVVRAL